MTLLVIATLGDTLLHIALGVWCFWHTFARYDQELPVALGVGISLTIMTSSGVASGVSAIWSDLHNGRGRGLGFMFAVSMLPGSLFLYNYLYLPVGFLLLVLSVWNVHKWRDTES